MPASNWPDGSEPQRADAVAKVTGAARYTPDISLPGMLHARALRSPHPHARILAVDTSRARELDGVHAVLTGADLAGINSGYGYYIFDQPVVAVDKVRYAGDIVAAVAAETRSLAQRAVQLIRVTYEPLPAVADIAAALADGAPELFELASPGIVPPYGPGAAGELRPRPNVCYRFTYETGGEEAWRACDRVFEDTFRFSRMQHLHLEPFATVADARGDHIEVWTSTQTPFPLRQALAGLLRVSENRITVHVPYVGGGFGAKSNLKTEPVAVLLSRMTGRPVRYCLSADEGFLTLSQHSAVLTIKTGTLADGTFVARESTVLLDAGAYSDASPLVAEKVASRVCGPYRWSRIAARCDCVMTNTTPAGPFRGFGTAQAAWAGESQVDMIARRLGIDPYDLRGRNLLRLGEQPMPGESAIDSDLHEGLRMVAAELGYHRPRAVLHGVGLAVGFKDGGGVNKPAAARVKISAAGDVYVSCGTVELGQGASSALCRIAASVLGIPENRATYAAIATDVTPYDQGAIASSGVAVMGQAVLRAALDARRQVLEFAARQLGCTPGELALEDWAVRLADRVVPLAELILAAFGATGFEFSGEGFVKADLTADAPLGSPSVFWEVGWAGAEVRVDPGTGQVTVEQLIAGSDVGHAISKLACRGQDEGAAMMGLAQALFEEMRFDTAGVLVNGGMLHYRAPGVADVPGRFVSVTQEQGHGPGPFGAKGAGEAAMLPVAAAIANAVEDAVGARVTVLPLTAERVLRAAGAAKPGRDIAGAVLHSDAAAADPWSESEGS